MLTNTDAILAPIGVSVRLATVQQRHSDNTQANVSSRLGSAARQVGAGHGHLLLAVVGQSTNRYDGWAKTRPPT